MRRTTNDAAPTLYNDAQVSRTMAHPDLALVCQTDGCYYGRLGIARVLVYRAPTRVHGSRRVRPLWRIAIDSHDVASVFTCAAAALRYARGAVVYPGKVAA